MSERFSAFNLNATPEQPTPRKYFDPEKDVPQDMWALIAKGRQQAAAVGGLQWETLAELAAFELLAGHGTGITPQQWHEIDATQEQMLVHNRSSLTLATILLVGHQPVDVTRLSLDSLAEQCPAYADEKAWTEFARMASLLMLSGRTIEISEAQWRALAETRQGFAADVQNGRVPDWHQYRIVHGFAPIATLEMLRDARIERDDEGRIARIIRPTEPTDFHDEKPPLPQTRNF